mmetsp:Transcript_28692/g.78754  ORF Transcript_28692/g.78754 Transcript_28692/m.78754 type:complete len:256 (-) Transcript_28692:327-1094(-)
MTLMAPRLTTAQSKRTPPAPARAHRRMEGAAPGRRDPARRAPGCQALERRPGRARSGGMLRRRGPRTPRRRRARPRSPRHGTPGTPALLGCRAGMAGRQRPPARARRQLAGAALGRQDPARWDPGRRAPKRCPGSAWSGGTSRRRAFRTQRKRRAPPRAPRWGVPGTPALSGCCAGTARWQRHPAGQRVGLRAPGASPARPRAADPGPRIGSTRQGTGRLAPRCPPAARTCPGWPAPSCTRRSTRGASRRPAWGR